jgi:hypothetical protein
MSNNVGLVDTVYVTDSVWARDNGEPQLPISASGSGAGFLGQLFVLDQPAALTSISGYLTSTNPCDVSFVVFAYNNGYPGTLPVATTDTVSLGANPGWVTLPLRNGPYYLSADTFLIAARQFGSVFIDLSLSYGHYIPRTTWVKWQAIPWTPIESYGSQYALPFMLRANISAPTAVSGEAMEEISMSAAPNPTQGPITLNYNFGAVTDAVIEVCNPLGEIIITSWLYNVESGQTVIDLQGQAAGVYMLAVTTTDEIKIVRIVVE